jgi:hypothetical protein
VFVDSTGVAHHYRLQFAPVSLHYGFMYLYPAGLSFHSQENQTLIFSIHHFNQGYCTLWFLQFLY